MRREAGFTLVEVLFALVAGGLLLAVLGWAIRGLEDQYRRHQAPSNAEKVEAVSAFLTSAVTHALPPATGAAFAGDATALSLTVPPPQALGAVGPVRLDLTVTESPSGKALVSRLSPGLPGQVLPATAAQPVTLAEGFRDIRFDYLRRATDPANTLPRLVTIQFTGQDGTVLPLGLEPRLTMAADCIFDPISLTCRH